MTNQLEERYIVVKLKDLGPVAEYLLRKVLQDAEIPTRDCVVVEADWPMYAETVAKVLGNPPQVAEETESRFCDHTYHLGTCTKYGAVIPTE